MNTYLDSATIAASSLLASAFTSGEAAEGGAAMAGVGAHMTARADCRPASFTPGLLALQAQHVENGSVSAQLHTAKGSCTLQREHTLSLAENSNQSTAHCTAGPNPNMHALAKAVRNHLHRWLRQLRTL